MSVCSCVYFHVIGLLILCVAHLVFFFFFQAEDGIRDLTVTGVQTCALPIWPARPSWRGGRHRTCWGCSRPRCPWPTPCPGPAHGRCGPGTRCWRNRSWTEIGRASCRERG